LPVKAGLLVTTLKKQTQVRWLSDGLAAKQQQLPADCTNGDSVILALPFTF